MTQTVNHFKLFNLNYKMMDKLVNREPFCVIVGRSRREQNMQKWWLCCFDVDGWTSILSGMLNAGQVKFLYYFLLDIHDVAYSNRIRLARQVVTRLSSYRIIPLFNPSILSHNESSCHLHRHYCHSHEYLDIYTRYV